MTLTEDDLQALQTLMQATVETTVKAVVQPMIDELAQDTAAGFAEVHARMDDMKTDLTKQIKTVDDKLDVKDGKLEDTVQRLEAHMADSKGHKKLHLKAA